MLGGNLRWTSIPSRGSRNTPSRFMPQKPETSAGTDEPAQLRLGQTLPLPYFPEITISLAKSGEWPTNSTRPSSVLTHANAKGKACGLTALIVGESLSFSWPNWRWWRRLILDWRCRRDAGGGKTFSEWELKEWKIFTVETQFNPLTPRIKALGDTKFF